MRLTSRPVVRKFLREFGCDSLEEMNVFVCVEGAHVFWRGSHWFLRTGHG